MIGEPDSGTAGADPGTGTEASVLVRIGELAARVLDQFKRPGRLRTSMAVLAIVLLLAASDAIILVSGGTPNAYVHAFYLPIVFAASRFHWNGAVPTAVVAGLLAGPLMPLSSGSGAHQNPAEWLVRLVAFVTIGCLVAALSKGSSRSFASMVTDVREAQGLRVALAQRQLVPHYQPIVDLRTEDVVGFEALCRWEHPVRGMVAPTDFIPLAERMGIDIAIGTHMLGEAVRQTAAWHAAGTRELVIAVNISANHLCQPEFIAHVMDALDGSGLRTENLCVEITETAIMQDRRIALANLRHLRELGVLISLDDFGTGQSSLSYLQEFPIDIVKIDQSFVSRVDVDAKCAALVLAIVQMARALGATTVGEGIERASQLQALIALGCTQGQGYYLGRPSPPLPSRSRVLQPQMGPIGLVQRAEPDLES